MRQAFGTMLVVAAMAGCTATPAKNNDPVPNGATNGSTTGECPSAKPTCADCSDASCEEGEWVCSEPFCDQPECPGDPPDCGCPEAEPTCHDGAWSCPDDPKICFQDDCVAGGESNLSGVEIVVGSEGPGFPVEQCVWTLSEVADGIEIPWAVSIEERHEVTPTSQQNGCDEPGPSGLAPRPRITGNEQSYCICDTGLCAGEMPTLTLEEGVEAFTLEWDGRNWYGPSDTGNPKGDPFPPGEYTVEVKAVGTSGETPYEVVGTLEIILVED